MKNKVTFNNKLLKLSGELFLPKDFNEENKYPAIVVAHPEGAVKEQPSALYAEKMSEYGYVVLTFDGAYMGESEGTPHFTTDPFQRVEDIRCAVDYLTTQKFIDQDNIFGLGICAGGAYTIDCAKTEKRFKAIGAVVPVDMGQGLRQGQGTKENMIATLKAVSLRRTEEVNGEEVQLMETVAASDEEAMKFPEYSLFREARSYYRGVGENPLSTGQMVFSSLDKVLRYSAFDLMNELWSHPLLVISGSKADTIGFAKQAVELSEGLGKLEVIEGASHVDLYYKEEYVNQAIKLLANFFDKNR